MSGPSSNGQAGANIRGKKQFLYNSPSNKNLPGLGSGFLGSISARIAVFGVEALEEVFKEKCKQLTCPVVSKLGGRGAQRN